MSFHSVHGFLAMGGHGLYVWLSYGAGLTIVAYNVLSVRVARRRFFQDARDRERRRAASSVAGRSGAIATGESAR